MNFEELDFEWDENKNKLNIKNHGISFKLAARVFQDENRIEEFDDRHSIEEERYITIGEVNGSWLVLYVVYTERVNRIRLISAREATNSERRRYYDGKL